jgi:hypothetical protein
LFFGSDCGIILGRVFSAGDIGRAFSGPRDENVFCGEFAVYFWGNFFILVFAAGAVAGDQFIGDGSREDIFYRRRRGARILPIFSDCQYFVAKNPAEFALYAGYQFFGAAFVDFVAFGVDTGEAILGDPFFERCFGADCGGAIFPLLFLPFL